MIWLLIPISLGLVLLYLLTVMWDAKHDMRKAPRTDMMLCDKHGAFPKKYAFNLMMDNMDPILSCPMCMEDRFKEAARR